VDRLLDILKSRFVRRSIIALYILALALGVGAYIGISTFHVEISAYVLGPDTLTAGQPNPVRGAILDTVEGDSFERTRVEFELRDRSSDSAEAVRIGSATSDDSGVFHANLQIPAERTGAQTLTIRASGPNLPKTFQSERSVRIAQDSGSPITWPEATNRVPETESGDVPDSPVLERSGAIAIDVLPPDGQLIRGLTNHFFLRTYDADTGQPVAAEITVDNVEGMGRWGKGQDLPESLTTDEMGLVELQLNPVGGMKLELKARRKGERGTTAEIGRAAIQLHTVAAQLSARNPDPLVSPGRPLRADLFSVFSNGHLLIDVYRDGDWVHATHAAMGATSTGDRGAQLRIPYAGFPGRSAAQPDSEAAQLYRLQIHRGLFGAGNSWESIWVARADGQTATAYHRALETVIERVARNTDDPYFDALNEPGAVPNAAEHATLSRWLRGLVSALPRHFSRPAQLFNTQKAQKERLGEWQRTTKGELRTAIGAALVGGLAVLLYVVVVGLRERQRHRARLQQADLEMELEAEDEPLFVEESWKARVGAGALIVAALATFVMFGLGLMLILTLM